MRPFAGAILTLSLLLGGCATAPVSDTAGVISPGNLSIPEYAVWQFRGRVSLVREEQGWHASLDWHESGGRYRLRLSGPLGQGALQVDGDGGGVRLRTADGSEYRAADADTLVESATGWELPVAGIRYWVRGIPAPGVEARITTDDRGRLQRLDQSGWDIHYDRYLEVDGRDWPTRLRLATADISIRLVVDQWTLSNSLQEVTADPAPATVSP